MKQEHSHPQWIPATRGTVAGQNSFGDGNGDEFNSVNGSGHPPLSSLIGDGNISGDRDPRHLLSRSQPPFQCSSPTFSSSFRSLQRRIDDDDRSSSSDDDGQGQGYDSVELSMAAVKLICLFPSLRTLSHFTSPFVSLCTMVVRRLSLAGAVVPLLLPFSSFDFNICSLFLHFCVCVCVSV
ncbi:hypothetical protein PIB30_073502 [Stylosanthes scabra]|uniref:Uncharacterized protein n=1 Tax=Stylosanthes scabra TaxID=79078 RepID=A0ABU6URN2_9FABA|nr:hypothetical protein [Stylosanthes scabra]